MKQYWILIVICLVIIGAVVFNKPKSKVVKNGDTVIIDFVGTVDGVAFAGGTADNYTLVIGSGKFVAGFEDQLIGMKVGEVRDVKVTFPTEYVAELAGKDAVFKTTLKSIKKV